MIVAIVGSRDFSDAEYMERMIEKSVGINNIELIVSGGAKGADRLAEGFAQKHDIPVKVYRANWVKYGKSAGMIRNGDIVNDADVVIAFWNGQSPGTKMTIRECVQTGTQYFVYTY